MLPIETFKAKKSNYRSLEFSCRCRTRWDSVHRAFSLAHSANRLHFLTCSLTSIRSHHLNEWRKTLKSDETRFMTISKMTKCTDVRTICTQRQQMDSKKLHELANGRASHSHSLLFICHCVVERKFNAAENDTKGRKRGNNKPEQHFALIHLFHCRFCRVAQHSTVLIARNKVTIPHEQFAFDSETWSHVVCRQ